MADVQEQLQALTEDYQKLQTGMYDILMKLNLNPFFFQKV